MKRNSILIGNNEVEFTVNRSKRRRRTVSLLVHPQQGLVVSAPANTSMARIREIVEDKGGWIVKQMNALAEMEPLVDQRLFLTGEPFLVLGEIKYIKILEDRVRKAFCREHGDNIEVLIPPGLDDETRTLRVRDALGAWYKDLAYEKVVERVDIYAPLLDLYPEEILIRSQKTRWGSCSHKGVLRFNWRIVMAPLELLDYIVVHELCHLQVPNHSPEFWGLVGGIIPDYKERRGRLKKEGLHYDF
ncbi:MAG: M48 family metallopeptidase [Ignavibacteriales bacterium]